MPEYIRALVVILGLACVVFAFAKSPATAVAISKPDFLNRSNTWLLITLAGFLSQNYWIFVVLLIVIVYGAAQKDSDKIALFFFLVLAFPQIDVPIPGFAGIRYFISIDYVRILILMLLIPVCLAARKVAVRSKSKGFLTDNILILYILLNLVLQARYDSVSGLTRSAVDWIIDVVLPYYAISRSVKSVKDFHDIFMSFAIAAMLASIVAIFEFSRSWLLYASAGNALGVVYDPGYLPRADYLRALATSGQPIVLGCVIVVAMGFYAALHKSVPNRKKYLLGFFLLAGGLLVTLSKGPWLGGAVLGLVLLLTGASVLVRSVKIAGAGILLGALLVSTDFGRKIISFLPFVGTVDEDNFTYRQRLFDISSQIILENPLFGSTDYLLHMEEMRQGQGIIDLVNTYLIVGLNTGFVGLAFYGLFFMAIGVRVFARLKQFPRNTSMHLLGRAILGSLVALLLMISSVSPIYHIPLLLWTLAALGLAYSRVANS